jgi:hypothetical protein
MIAPQPGEGPGAGTARLPLPEVLARAVALGFTVRVDLPVAHDVQPGQVPDADQHERGREVALVHQAGAPQAVDDRSVCRQDHRDNRVRRQGHQEEGAPDRHRAAGRGDVAVANVRQFVQQHRMEIRIFLAVGRVRQPLCDEAEVQAQHRVPAAAQYRGAERAGVEVHHGLRRHVAGHARPPGQLPDLLRDIETAYLAAVPREFPHP